MMTYRIKWLILGSLMMMGISAAQGEVVIEDLFQDGTWNAGGHWDPPSYLQGQNLDTIVLDEAFSSGLLTLQYFDDGAGDLSTLILRNDVTVGIGQYVQADVRIAEGPWFLSINPQAGIGLASSRNRNAPDTGEMDRSNALYWRVRNNGVVVGHCYGANNAEIGDHAEAIGDYHGGKWITVAIHRVGAGQYDLYWAPTGQALTLSGSFTYEGTTGAGEEPPAIPGLMLENGLDSFVAQFDNFAVGNWPPPINPEPPPGPTPTPLPRPQEVTLELPADIDDLPKLESTRHVIQMPQGDGDHTYHHGALIEYWKGKIYVAWHSTPVSELTYPYEGRVSSSIDGETWSEPVDPGASGLAAYRAYMQDRLGISSEDIHSVNAAPRHWHATEDRLYLWSLGWVRRNNGNQDWVGRIFWTEDGETWNEISPQELKRLEEEENLTIRAAGSNRGFIRLDDGRLMAAAMESVYQDGLRRVAPTTTDPTGLTGWTGGWVDTSDCPDVGEPGGWQGRDGVLHYACRFDQRIWHAYSSDDGQSWSKLRPQNGFTDSPSNKKFGKLPDGSIFYIGNPVPGTRKKLVLGISHDGWTFDQNFLVRWEEDIQPIWPADGKTFSGLERVVTRWMPTGKCI